jgi:hypothetical protein
MARIRSIKPELRTSDLVASWPIEMRYFFVLLWGYLDDKGRGLDAPKQIAGDCFPHDEKITSTHVDNWLEQMRVALRGTQGPICRYEVDGRRYLHCVNWGEHQRPNRPTPSRLPPCPLHETLSEPLTEELTESLTETPLRDSVPGAGEQGSRGAGEQYNNTAHRSAAEMFARFYAAYPRKAGRKAAEKAWAKALKDGTDPEMLVQAAGRYAGERAGQDPKFTPHPATWLNQGRWDDDPEPVGPRVYNQPQTGTGSRRMDKVLSALDPNDPFLAQYGQAPPDSPAEQFLVIEGGRSA